VPLADNIKQQYIGLRGNQADKAGAGARYTTARTLMSILRLSQSVAKLRFDDRVTMVSGKGFVEA
jgi:DNA replication licensing factor MCM7